MSTTHERPGVYSSFDASSLIQGGSGYKVVGAVGYATTGTALTVSLCSSAAQAKTLFGTSSSGIGLTELVTLALQNGASTVVAVPAAIGQTPTTQQYTDALEKLAERSDIDIVICDSAQSAVHDALLEHVTSCSQVRKERIGIVAASAGESVSQLVDRAAKLNSERMVLLAPCPTDADGTAMEQGALATAAVAGAIALESDPAVPLGGATLEGLAGLETYYGDGDLDTLIRGGVTPLEEVGGTVSVIRGITTRTTTSEVEDTTWRELSTILVVDSVIPDVRNTLRAKFVRVKNTVQTRSAIASQVVITLEDKVSREIIDSYDSVTVTADSEDPTRCLVNFNFTVAHGLNQIHIAAHITV